MHSRHLISTRGGQSFVTLLPFCIVILPVFLSVSVRKSTELVGALKPEHALQDYVACVILIFVLVLSHCQVSHHQILSIIWVLNFNLVPVFVNQSMTLSAYLDLLSFFP